MVKKVKKVRRFKRWVWVLILVCSGIGLFVTEIIFFKWNDDNGKIEKQLKDLDKDAEVRFEQYDGEAEEINPPNDKQSDYWSYMKLPMISVDFNELKKKNSDTIAFLNVSGTKVNYPVVQTSNNSYYLNHAFDKSKNSAGWVFLDYRNDIKNFQDNTIIYAHGRVDKTMFGSLKNALKNEWYSNKDNHIIYLSTISEGTIWQVFSVYVVPTETYYLTSSFGSNDSKNKFIEKIVSRSVYSFNTDVDINDKFLTLSTCYNEKEKLVIHAKLIKRQAK